MPRDILLVRLVVAHLNMLWVELATDREQKAEL
jgi:hypothetical protein